MVAPYQKSPLLRHCLSVREIRGGRTANVFAYASTVTRDLPSDRRGEAAMKPIDERQPEEQDPEYEELMTLLQNVNLDPRLVDPQERTHILAQARTRLFQTNPEFFKPVLREPGSFPSGLTALASKSLRGRRLPHVLNMLAAVLVVVVLLGGSLLLFQLRLTLNRNRVTNGTGANASCIAKNGMMVGFDAQHTNANPFERILNPTNVGDLKEKWVSQTKDQIDSSPAVVGGVVYVGSADDNVYALDAASGTKKWAYHTGNNVDSPAVVGGVVYVGSADGNVYALDAASGTKKWAYHSGGPVLSSPTVAGCVVYVGSADGNVYALDAASGAKKGALHTGYITSSPAGAGGVVYAGSDNGMIYAVDAASGAKKWAYSTGG